MMGSTYTSHWEKPKDGITRIVATGADTKYFGALLSLISSLFRSGTFIDKIFVYDLGLTSFQRQFLSGLQKVSLKGIPPFCSHAFDLTNFAWKPAAICDALFSDLDAPCLVLWCDAGLLAMKSLDPIFQSIEQNGYMYNVSPFDEPNCKIAPLTHDSALQLLKMSYEKASKSLMVNAGFQGYRSDHKASSVAKKAKEYAADPKIICGPRGTHRHDQSIYSALRVENYYKADFWMIHEKMLFDKPFLIRAWSDGCISHEEVRKHVCDSDVFLFLVRDSRPFYKIWNLPTKQFRQWLYIFYWMAGGLFIRLRRGVGALKRKFLRNL